MAVNEAGDARGFQPQRRELPLNQLIHTFRNCLLAVSPYMDEVGITWRDDDAYDDWDRITEALFKSVVNTPVTFTFWEGQHLGLPPYDFGYSDAALYSVLFDEALGIGLRFYRLEQGAEPFDTVCFIPVENIGSDHIGVILKPLQATKFAVLLRSPGVVETRITRVANIE